MATRFFHDDSGPTGKESSSVSARREAASVPPAEDRAPGGRGVHYYVASFPFEHAHVFQRAFRLRFPRHVSAFVPDMRAGQVKMYVSPDLTAGEWKAWNELYLAKCRELALE